ncbi:hypothetical protein D8B26_001033 [Coccidioides posadasii str. Silveira]|uniref:Uncharacterized protein n=1 Tax=Coccidioides posadasii (strain RMSCC 757 / Silveira) TaxID=443226 RepID=E9CU63_COCPS|nr:conserved hypothetical protein [Coccidioides posadasii str. Silveira]QVM06321.1 hypothetical protein D8B26_001033 [Coccidioides posadasii str. Silveira]
MADVLAPPYHHSTSQLCPHAGGHSQKSHLRPVGRMNSLSYCPTRKAWIPNAYSVPSQVSISGVYSPSTSSLLEYEPELRDNELVFPDYDPSPDTNTDDAQPRKSTSDSKPTSVRDDDDLSSDISEEPRTAGDDSCVERRPTRQVDYLTHDWKDEEIWGSWKYMKRNGGSFRTGQRLENAAWRSWTKSFYRLRTITPESLNWLKDADVTWLFGPLQEDHTSYSSSPPPASTTTYTSNSYLSRKPILKKTSVSQAILQHSLSASSLLQHNFIIKSQSEDFRLGFSRTVSDTTVRTAHMGSSLRATRSTLSTTASDMPSPGSRRHITFNRVVSQVVAVGREDEEDEDDDENYSYSGEYCLLDDDDSEATLVTMKQLHPRRSLSSTPRSSFSSDTRTIIAHLPPTTLKFDSDSETEDEAQYFRWSGERASFYRSASTDTIKVHDTGEVETYPSSEHLEYVESDNAYSWPFKSTLADVLPSSPSPPASPSASEALTDDNGDEEWYLSSSGVFMPCAHGELAKSEEAEGDRRAPYDLLGKAVDVANTLRDIVHVLWNVGWRP